MSSIMERLPLAQRLILSVTELYSLLQKKLVVLGRLPDARRQPAEAYNLPLERLPGLLMKDQLADIHELMNFLDSRGIRTAATRIERYRNWLAAQDSGDRRSSASIFKEASAHGIFAHELDWHVYVTREVNDLMWILRGLKLHMPAGADEKLRDIASGSDFAVLDKNRQYRDTQFELRVASYFCQSGCEVDMSSQTDIIATCGRHAFFIECKRVSNHNKAVTRLSEAVAQLQKRMPEKHQDLDVYGTVAMDITQVAYAHQGLLFPLTQEHGRDLVRKRLLAIETTLNPKRHMPPGSQLIMCMLQIHMPAFVRHPPQVMSRFTTFTVITEALGGKTLTAAQSLSEIFNAGAKPDSRLRAPVPLTLQRDYAFPAGSRFQIDEALFKQFRKRQPLGPKLQDDIVATLHMNGQVLEFSYFDFEMCVLSMEATQRKELSKNTPQARLQFIAIMYAMRFPYTMGEDEEETAGPTLPNE